MTEALGTQPIALTMIPSASIQLLDVATEAAVRTAAASSRCSGAGGVRGVQR
jgi:hypothetical protein